MKTMIFPPQGRPILNANSVPKDTEIPCKLVELGKDSIILQSAVPLPLRGSFSFKKGEISFSKIEQAHIEDIFYSEIRVSADNLFALKVYFMARQNVADITHWVMSSSDSMSKEKPSEYQGEYQAQQEIEKNSPAPPENRLSEIIGGFLSFFYRHTALAIFLLVLLCIYPATQISKLSFDPSLDRLLVQTGEEMKQYKSSIELFGPDRVAIIYFEDPKIFTREKLTLLRKLAWKLQTYPKAQKVQSLFTTSFIHAKDETVYTEPAYQDLEDMSDQEILTTLDDLERDPLLKGRLFSRKNNSLVIILPILTQYKQLSTIAKELEEYMVPYQGQFEKAFLTGEPKVELFGEHEMKSSQKIYIPLIGLILLVSFYFFIRSLSAFFVTLFVTGFSIFLSFGLMTALQIPVQMMVSLIPSIVLMLSATEIIHIFSSFHFALEKGLTKEEAMKFIGSDIGKALFLTFSTTALGFLSIRFSDILILQEFALVSFMALVVAFIATMIYFPIHAKVFIKNKKSEESSSISQNKVFQLATHYFTKFYYQTFQSKKALYLLALFAIVNAFLGLRLYVDNDAYAMLADSTQVKKEINYFKDHLGGTKNIHIVLEAKEGSFENPELLNLLWNIHNELTQVKDVVHVESFAAMMALLNREMISGKEEDYRVPSSRNLIAQYMLTLSRDDLDPLITTDKRKVNIKIAHDVSSSQKTALLVERLKKVVSSFDSESSSFQFHLTSRNILNLHAAHTIVNGQVSSLITMGIIIVLMLSLFFKSFKIGLLSLIPNLFPIFGLFGIMAIFNIPLNVGTCIVAAITIGIAADDTIHLFSRYLLDEKKSANPVESASMTIEEEVIPIITTSLSLAFSYVSFGLSSFIPLVEFGALSAYVLLLAVISDLYIGPAILSFFVSHEKGLKDFKIPLLLHSPELVNSQLFENFNNQELYSTIKQGELVILSPGEKKLKRYITEKETFLIPLKGQGKEFMIGSPLYKERVYITQPSILLKITKSQLTHLSPRIFSKFCNNLKK